MLAARIFEASGDERENLRDARRAAARGGGHGDQVPASEECTTAS